MSFANEAVAGCAAGVIGTVFGYPFDVMKTRMQTAQTSLGATAKSIVQESGVKGFYVGLMSPLVALTILNTMNFTAYNFMCETFQVRGDRSEDGRFLRTSSSSFMTGNYAIAGASVGPLAALISTPFELVKTQVQLQRKMQVDPSARPKGSLHMAIEIVREHGPLALFRGHVVNTTREVVFLGTYFMVYEHGKDVLQSLLPSLDTNQPSKIAIPLAGGIAGAIGWFVSFPLDNVKSNIQGGRIVTGASPPSMLSVARQVLAQKGIRGLYSGVVPSITRSFIVSATRFSVYESVLQHLRQLERE